MEIAFKRKPYKVTTMNFHGKKSENLKKFKKPNRLFLFVFYHQLILSEF